jgi:mRNA interferase MazF
VTRGEVWLAQVGRKRRPVVILTRTEVIDVRQLVTVADITTTIRGLSVEVDFDHEGAGINRPSVINCDGLHTIARASLAKRLGSVDNTAMAKVCGAMSYALGC